MRSNPVQGPKQPKPKTSTADLQDRWRAQRSPMRAAFEDRRADEFFVALRDLVLVDDQDCWRWQRKLSRPKKSSGAYGLVRWAGRTLQVHRLSAEMRYGNLDGQVVHHACANTSCVNPDHLQPISHRENVAEMLQRTYFVERIARLEDALRELDSAHPLLPEAGAVAS